jgi:hypothetical protein
VCVSVCACVRSVCVRLWDWRRSVACVNETIAQFLAKNDFAALPPADKLKVPI